MTKLIRSFADNLYLGDKNCVIFVSWVNLLIKK